MIPQRIPPVLLRAGHDAGANRIEIDIGQAVDQGFAVFNDAAFKPFSQEGSPAMVFFSDLTLIVIACEGLLYFFEKLGKTCPFVPVIGNLTV